MPAKLHLTTKQKQQLKKNKKKHSSELIRDRAHAVLLRGNGFTITNTAKALLRSEWFVKEAIKKFKKGELDKNNCGSNNRKLSKQQREEIIKMVRTKCPKELSGFESITQFWSTDILKQVIKSKYGVEYKTEKSYYDLFKQAGFSFKKPKTKDFRQDPEKIKEFKGALKKSSTSTRIRLSW